MFGNCQRCLIKLTKNAFEEAKSSFLSSWDLKLGTRFRQKNGKRIFDRFSPLGLPPGAACILAQRSNFNKADCHKSPAPSLQRWTDRQTDRPTNRRSDL